MSGVDYTETTASSAHFYDFSHIWHHVGIFAAGQCRSEARLLLLLLQGVVIKNRTAHALMIENQTLEKLWAISQSNWRTQKLNVMLIIWKNTFFTPVQPPFDIPPFLTINFFPDHQIPDSLSSHNSWTSSAQHMWLKSSEIQIILTRFLSISSKRRWASTLWFVSSLPQMFS